MLQRLRLILKCLGRWVQGTCRWWQPNSVPFIQPWLKRVNSAPRTCAKYSERAVGPKNFVSPVVPKYSVPVNLVGECRYGYDIRPLPQESCDPLSDPFSTEEGPAEEGLAGESSIMGSSELEVLRCASWRALSSSCIRAVKPSILSCIDRKSVV